MRALATDPPEGDDEDTLNWALEHHIRHAILDRRRAGIASIDPPALEPKSTSVGALAAGPALRDRKRPDLVWAWIDEHAAGAERPFLEMVIECKRLGNGDLCRLYVANGVTRFVNEEHAYAKHMRSAFMVGYLQDMSVRQAEHRMSGVLRRERLAPLEDPALQNATFAQRLRRPYPVDPFCLHHLWQVVPTRAHGARPTGAGGGA